MKSNSNIELLEKIANDLMAEPMVEDTQPIPSPEEVAEAQAENDLLLQSGIPSEPTMDAELTEEELAILNEEQAIEQIEEEIVEEAANEILAEQDAVAATLEEKVASELVAVGTIAKLIECSRGDLGEDLEKQANEIIEEMVQSDEAFDAVLNKTAGELFGAEDNYRALFSEDGVAFAREQLAFLNSEEFEKTANTGGALSALKQFTSAALAKAQGKIDEAMNIAKEVKEVGVEAVRSATQLGSIKKELDPIKAQNLEMAKRLEVGEEAFDHNLYQDQLLRQNELERQQMHGRAAIGAGAALGTGAAIGAGKLVYDHMHNEEKVATVLPDTFYGGTLDVETQSEPNGGIQKMSKELVQDFLKVAGAAGLIGIVNNEEVDMEIRKEASEAFDYIAGLGNSEMGAHFLKVATQIFSDEELHEIVAGHHTDTLLEKVAFFTDSLEESNESLEKIANAGGVGLIKSVGAGLKNAADNIAATVHNAKVKAEGAGREYVGTLKGHNGKGAQAGAVAGTGLAGGGLVAGGLAGYNALKNPQEYDIDKTASMIQEAELLKEAADRFIQAFSK